MQHEVRVDQRGVLVNLIPQYTDVPQVRDEQAALTDVELAQHRRGIDVEPESEPEPITVGDATPARAVRVATDGGVVVFVVCVSTIPSNVMRISTAHAGEDAQSTTAVLVIPGGTRPTLH